VAMPDHRTLAAFVLPARGDRLSLFRDLLLVCAEQGLLGGTHFALEGVKLPSDESLLRRISPMTGTGLLPLPGRQSVKLKPGRHQIENNSYRRYEAAEADCQGCRSGAMSTHPRDPGTNTGQLARQAQRPLPKDEREIDMPAAREIMGSGLAIVEPVLGTCGSQKR